MTDQHDELNPPEFDYSDYEEPPQEDDLKKLTELAARQVYLEALVIKAEEDLRKAKENLRQISEFDLPAVMDRLKLESFTTTDGVEIEVSEKIRASIAEKNEKAAFKWLRDNGHDAIIKRNIAFAFGKGEDAQADAFLDLVASAENLKLTMSDKSSVHANTLSSLVKRLLQDGEDVPTETLNVYRQRFSKVK